MRALLKSLSSIVGVDSFERPLAYSILRNQFAGINLAKRFEKREELWDECIGRLIKTTDPVLLIEFGVREGYSIKYFAQRNTNDKSRFFGLDSFEGLPEAWGTVPKGTFDTKGKTPTTNDDRISYIKGWFQDTWELLFAEVSKIDKHALVVHYDADLYSSTLFALAKIDSLKVDYYAIFDEFAGHETRALYNYAQAFNASVSFLGKTLVYKNYPTQVLCKIAPKKSFK
jgi:O-methyltransferase